MQTRPFRENLAAAGLMVGSMAAFTGNDAFLKAVSDEMPFFQAIFLRSLATLVFFSLIAWRTGALRVPEKAKDRWLIAWRSLGEVGAAYFFLNALFNMPIANATAIIQVLPLTVTLAAALFLGEPIGWRRVGAIVVGAIGVLIIIRPGPEGFNLYAIYALIAVACVTLRDLCARRLSPEVPSVTVSLAAVGAVLAMTAFGSVATTDWVRPSPWAWFQLAASTVLIMVAYQLSVLVMRTGEIAFVAPFRYSAILFALVIGLFVFREWPDPVTLLGVAIVVGAGVYTFLRERRVSRADAA